LVDTCHIWDGGYNIKTSLDFVLEQFDRYIGKEYIYGMHINDSMNELGNGKDRHQSIGEGYIGMGALYKIVTHPWFKDLPKALETPNKPFSLDTWKSEIKKFKDYSNDNF
jgi:deoxyribonuclease-4